MKSIGRLKLICAINIVLILFIPLCLSEPYFSTKANITPVKLFQIAPRNVSSANTRNSSDSVFGSVAKISRVVPLKHVPKLRNNNFRNSSHSGIIRTQNYSKIAKRKENFTASLENRPVAPNVKFPSRNRNTTTKLTSKVHKAKTTTTTSTTPSPTTSTSTISSTYTNQVSLSSDYWDYLNSVVSDDELREMINGLSEEVMKTISEISKQDPIAGQNFLMKNIIGMLKTMKQPRMLDLDIDKPVNVNKGVRFSAKQQKPVLNVVPLEQKVKLGKPTKTLMKTDVIEHWNISGLISNDFEQNETILSENADFEKTQHLHHHKEEMNDTSKLSSVFKASPIHPGSTTPSLMQVLAVPEVGSSRSTSSPFLPVPSNLKSGFLPMSPTTNNIIAQDQENPSMHETMLIPLEDIQENMENATLLESGVFPARKPRVPPKDDEYLLPSITSTTSTTNVEDIGYQTITGSTTPGPKVIWYKHNQTPEDTFYPNSDTFLMPPDESSIEILTDLLSGHPLQDDPSLAGKASYSSSSSEISYGNSNSKIKIDKKARPVLHYNSKEDFDDIGNLRGNWGSRKSIEKDINKKTNKNAHLQPAATTTNHDRIRDYHVENGASSGRHHERKRYAPASSNSHENEIRHHEIIPRHQKTNRKPPYTEHDTESNGEFNEVDHYHDSYPHTSPVVSTRHEIGPYRYRSHNLEENVIDDDNYYKGGPIQSNREPYRDDGPSTDSEYFHKQREPKYKLKEASPYLGNSYGNHQGYHGSGGGGGGDYHGQGVGYGQGGLGGGNGWKPSSDFFSHATNYFKNSDFSTVEKWFDVSIGGLAFLAFGGYIIMLLYQVFAISSGTSIGTLFGRSMRGAGEIFDLVFSKGPMGEAYMNELETIVKRAMANVKRTWMTNSIADNKKVEPKVKGETKNAK